jgi:hypothetical protein
LWGGWSAAGLCGRGDGSFLEAVVLGEKKEYNEFVSSIHKTNKIREVFQERKKE